jgi:glycosyltransferase involved in cell wall biosynthesis
MLMVRELAQGGCERDVARLAKYIDRSKFFPHVACFVPNGVRSQELRDAGIPIVHIPVTSFKSWSLIEGVRVMRRYLREHQIKVVHAFDVPTVILGVPVAYSSRMPAIVSAQLGRRDLHDGFAQKLLRFTDHLAQVVVANSQYIQQYLIDSEGVPAERTYLCYNGIETAIFHPAVEPKPPSVASAPLVIGTICALRTEKRVDLLIQAFAQVRHLVPGMKLLIVGSGIELPKLEALRTELNLGDDCIFEPAKTNIVPWMRALDIFVISSETESFPNGLLEAMACGCACVGSRVGGIPELIDNGVSGLLFESQNVPDLAAALTKLIQDPALRQRFAQQAAAEAADKFSLNAFVHRNEALYDKLLAAKV